MESDERFKHLALDPRFKTIRKKDRKVEIDDRFKSMFTDKKFTLKYTKDKRGSNQKKTSGDDLRKYYSLEEKNSRDKPKNVKVDEKKKPKVDQPEEEEEDDDDVIEEESDSDNDAEDNSEDDEEDNAGLEEEEEDNVEIEEEDEESGGSEEDEEEESESELSSSSDESESERESGEEEGDEVDVDKIEYDWQPLDHDAETGDQTTKRLAIQNLDWDHLDVKDVYTLVHSIRPPLRVTIYVSEFGKERLKEEELHGPKEIVEMPKDDEEDEEEYNMLKKKMEILNSKEPKTYKVNEYEDADEEMDPKNEEIRERVRRYQLSRMKYYYAVAEFDSVESAEVVYKELDGMEYEGSSLELDLRFIPDDIEFNVEDVKAECDKVPDLSSYTAPQFINSALQQTTVKFTWDETDIKRQGKLQRAYTKNELEKDDLEAYLGSETESEEEEEEGEGEFNDAVSVVTANSEARINKYKMLLASLEEEAEKKKKVDVDVEWGNYSEDEEKLKASKQPEVGSDCGEENDSSSGEELDDEIEEVDDESNDSDIAPERQSKLNKKKKKKEKEKKNKRGKKKRDIKEKEDEEEGEDKAELDLLVMDVNGKEAEEFKFNPDDDRFKAVYESGVYNIDPSHPNFKRTEAFDVIAEKKRSKRQRTNRA